MAGIAARGVTLTGAGGAAIVNVTNISGPALGLDTEDVTAHDSVGGWEEVVATILRSGEVTLDINYNPAAATHKNAALGLLYMLINRVLTAWTIAGPLGAWTFSAYVTKFEPSAPFDGKLTASVSLKISGAVTAP
jgi:predicted secreted protein